MWFVQHDCLLLCSSCITIVYYLWFVQRKCLLFCGSYNANVYYVIIRIIRLFIILWFVQRDFYYYFMVRTTRMFISLWFVQHDCLLFCGSYDVRVYYFVVRTTRMFLIFWFVQSKCLLFSDAKVYYFEIEGVLKLSEYYRLYSYNNNNVH